MRQKNPRDTNETKTPIRVRITGSAISITLLVLSSLAGALVFPISSLGRTTPSSISKEWLLLLLIPWLMLIGWALIYSRLLQKCFSIPTERSLYCAALCHIPLFLTLSLVVAVYQSDFAHHAYLNSPYGQLIFQPMAKVFAPAATALAQAVLLGALKWQTVARALPLSAIVIVALGLRLWNLNWGLPALYHWDEHHYIGRALIMMRTGDLNPHYFQNPSLIIYIDYILYRLLSPHIQAFQLITSFFGFDILDPRGDYLLDLAARSVSALSGTLTVVAVYWAGKELFNWRTGIYAAAILAVSLLHVRDSHYATNDILATFFLALSFVFSARIYSCRCITDYLLAAFFGGLATATKYNAGFFWVAIVVSHFLNNGKLMHLRPLKPHIPLIAAGPMSLVAFALGTPYAFLDFPYFVHDFGTQFGFGSTVWHGQDTLPSALLYLNTLFRGVGTIPILLACLGALIAAWRQRYILTVLLSVPVAYLVFMSTQQLFFIRFAIPLSPFIVILAGYAVENVSRYANHSLHASFLSAILLTAALVEPFTLSWHYNYLVGQEDTRAVAVAWIENNLPLDTKIASEVHSRLHTPFCWKGRQIRTTSTFQPSNENEAAEVLSGRFDYVIISSFGYDVWLRKGNADVEMPKIYAKLDRVGGLVAEFRPGQNHTNIPYANDDDPPFWHIFDRERPGPKIKYTKSRDDHSL